MLYITRKWTYNDKLQETKFGLSLQVYSQEQRKWVHIAFFKPTQIEQAKKEYEKTMKWHAKDPKHLTFSFNNLIEVERLLEEEMNTDRYVDMLNMITSVSHILQIRIEDDVL